MKSDASTFKIRSERNRCALVSCRDVLPASDNSYFVNSALTIRSHRAHRLHALRFSSVETTPYALAISLLALFLLTFPTLAVGPFQQIEAPIIGVYKSAMAWGDYDSDGDQDLAISGYDGTNRIARIYRNDNGDFLDSGLTITPVVDGSLAWGDYDNDGDLDLALAGLSDAGQECSIYSNAGNVVFIDLQAGLVGLSQASLAWGDFDGDGDLDLAAAGNIATGGVAIVYRNLGNSQFADIGAGLVGATSAALVWADIDNDNDLDLTVSGGDMGDPTTTVYSNQAGVAFQVVASTLLGVRNGSLNAGDYDNDGDLDLCLSGFSSCPRFVSRIYSNEAGALIDVGTDLASLASLGLSSVAWGDYDGDDDLDLALSGVTGGSFYPVTTIYNHDANSGVFSSTGPGLQGAYDGSIAWVDYDSDTDLDVALSGYSTAGPIFTIYSNSTSAAQESSAASPTIETESLDTLEFSSATYTVDESMPSAEILVTRRGSLSGPLSVSLTTGNGSATAGIDFVAPDELLIPHGVAGKAFVITLIDDDHFEHEETAQLRLGDILGDAQLGSLNNAVLTIVDEDLDGDGQPDDWERASFNSVLHNGERDFDGDGMRDKHEYIAGTDPTNALSVLSLWLECRGTQSDQIAIYWPSVLNRTYNLYGATNLHGDMFEPVSTGLPAVPPMNVYTTTIDQSQFYFYRVGVEN